VTVRRWVVLLITGSLISNRISDEAARAATSGPLPANEPEFRRQFERDRNESWNSFIADAGKPKGGMKLVAHLSRSAASAGERIVLTLWVKNVCELPSRYSFDRYGSSIGAVLVRDEVGRPVALSAEGWRRYEPKARLSSSVAFTLQPGDAVSESYPLSDDFLARTPGKYAVLATWEGGQGGTLVAEPVTFTLMSKGAPVKGDILPTAPTPRAPNPSFSHGTTQEWNALLKSAGSEFRGHTLDCAISPYSPNAVHLVVSITCLDKLQANGWVSNGLNGTIRRGCVPSNYRIMIRDSTGKAAALTKSGQEFFQRQCLACSRDVQVGRAIGAWFPLDEFFDLKSGQDYTVLVMIPEKPASAVGLISKPLTIHVPELQIEGVTRPLHGSDELWPKLVAQVRRRNVSIAIDFTTEDGDNAMLLFKEPRIILRNRPQEKSSGEWSSTEVTVLVRDRRGKPVLPIPLEDNHDEEVLKAFPAAADILKTAQRSDATDFRPVRARSKDAFAFLKFPRSYPTIPREPYSIIVAVRLFGNSPAFVTAGPLTYVPTARCDKPSKPNAPVASNVDVSWQALTRFAGKRFSGLALTATNDKPGSVTVSLKNNSKRFLRVRRWEGISGYVALARTADGKSVPLSKAQNERFEAGPGLKVVELKPQEVDAETVAVADLFDAPAPGEYTLLVSLPVIGDVDSILTADPIKVRVNSRGKRANAAPEINRTDHHTVELYRCTSGLGGIDETVESPRPGPEIEPR
jgi:hypothetical protein